MRLGFNGRRILLFGPPGLPCARCLLWFRVQGSCFRVRVQGLGFRAQGLDLFVPYYPRNPARQEPMCLARTLAMVWACGMDGLQLHDMPKPDRGARALGCRS